MLGIDEHCIQPTLHTTNTACKILFDVDYPEVMIISSAAHHNYYSSLILTCWSRPYLSKSLINALFLS